MMDSPPPHPLPADAAGKPKKPQPPPPAAALRPPDQQGLRCPRCDSPNTKFCYYNNYSLTQPRHFCKTCRRYWTKGGALRNVPIGGGCRKAKKSKSSSSSSSSTIAASTASTINSSSSSSARLPIDTLKFFSPPASAFDFQLGMLPFHSAAAAAHLVPLADYTSSPNYHVSDLGVVSGNGHHSAIAASIESLSNINQDLHWKLQQQRLAMLFGGGCGEGLKDSLPAAGGLGDGQAMEPISFQVADGPKGEAACGARADHAATTTAWFLDNPYSTSLPNSNPSTTTANAAGIKAWNGMHHFAALP